MAQTNYTPISLYYSTTASAAPIAGNLVNGELAINITDGKLYYKDNTGTVKVLAGSGGAGIAAGSNTQIQYNSSGAFGASSSLTFDGTTFSAPNSVITSASSSDALRITQTGTGNALLVEDSANPDSSPFVVDASGSVGIGTTTPVQPLEVIGAGVSFRSSKTVSAASNTRIYGGAFTGNLATIAVINAATGANTLYIGGGTGGGEPATTILFQTGTAGTAGAGTERVRIDSSGNVGIGVTPSAWALSSGIAQLGNASLLGYTGTASQLDLGANYFYNGTSNLYIASNFSTIYRQQNGVHRWYNAPSGTAGAAITFTQVMTLDASGNLGIGKTSPATKLDVVGTVQAAAAATQDAVRLAGRAGGTSSFAVTLTPTTLTASRTLTLPNNSGTVLTTGETVTVDQGGTGQTTYTDGQLLIGNTTGNTLTKTTLTAGTGVTITNGSGSITISATGTGGTVTSVTFTGGIISVANGTTTPAFTVAGTSGGIPYFSSGTTWATSAALAASALVVGGGAGAAPATITTGTGVVTALGVNTGTAGAFVVNGGALGTPSSGTLTNATGLPISTGVSGLGTGVATALGNAANATGGFTTINGTATLTNKRIDPRIVSAATALTLTPDFASFDIYSYTALATNLAIAVPTGTPVGGDKLIFRFLDNGTTRTITFTGGVSGGFRPIGISLTTSGSDFTFATTINKLTYIGFIYNADALRWDGVALTTQA